MRNKICSYFVSVRKGGEGGVGNFEIVSKMKKVRKCLKQENPFVKKRKTPLNVMIIVFAKEKLTNVFFLNYGGRENNKLNRRLKSDR